MQTIGPYALRDLLGAGPAGRVWRAVDQQGNQVTMAVLEGQAAVDPQSRWQFSATVEQVRQSAPVGGPVAADLVGQQPWVAFPDDGGASAANVFAAMGAPCQPVTAPAGQQVPGQPVSGQPVPGQPVSAQPMSAQPMSGQPMSAQPMSGQPMSGQPMSGQPMSGAPGAVPPVPGQPMPTPVSGMPASGAPMGSGFQPPAGGDDEPATTMIRPDAGGAVPPQANQAGQFGVPGQQAGQPEQFGAAQQQSDQFGAEQPPGFGTASAPNPFEPVDPFNAGGQQAAAAPDPFAPQGQQQSGFAGQQAEPFAAPQAEPFGGQQAGQFTPPRQQQSDQFGGQQPPQQYPPLSAEPEEKPRRTGLLIGLVILIVVVLGGGIGGAVYFTRDSGTPQTKQSASAEPTGGKSTAPQGEPTPHTQKSAPSTPKHPGKEPPKDASWPSSFAKFGSGDKTKTMSGLAGLGFDFVAPSDWTCTKKDQSTSYVNYHCVGSKTKAGGDVIVRTCGEPCDAAKKINMREQEEAFGLRWQRDGGNSSWAQADKVTAPDGSSGYGLVLVRYWHSKPGGPMDRQVVLRLTAPPSAKSDVQKVANSVRDATQ
jgi:hypothetical protein